MARVVRTLPSSRRDKYPWDEWLDGRVWELVRGEDFTVPTSDFARFIRATARRRRTVVVVRVVDASTIRLQAQGPSEEE